MSSFPARPSVFHEEFESAAQAIVAGGALILTHGLSAAPRLVQGFLKCVTAQANWAVGDELQVDAQSTLAGRGYVVTGVDGTDIRIRYGLSAGTFETKNKTTGVTTGLTNTSWQFFVRAWA